MKTGNRRALHEEALRFAPERCKMFLADAPRPEQVKDSRSFG